MSKDNRYIVRPVVCDYDVLCDGELKLICNNRQNAMLIKDILEKDDRYGQGFIKSPQYTEKDFATFIIKNQAKIDGRTINEDQIIEKITRLQDEVRNNADGYANVGEIVDILDYVLVLIGNDEIAENDAKENDGDSVNLKKVTELVSEAQLNANDNFGMPNAKEVAEYLLEHGMSLEREGEWVFEARTSVSPFTIFKCTECGEKVPMPEHAKLKHCPNCTSKNK